MSDRLITPSYCCILAANFLLFFAFWLLVPVLPFYLAEVFAAGNAAIGLILSCYTLAALCIRPFSGYLLDTFARKPLYLLAFTTFTAILAGYPLAGTLAWFTMLRILHGIAFGMVTVAGNTVVIDIMPSSRRGEGLGYYGLANNMAMSVGPMVGLFMHNTCTFTTIFLTSFAAGVLGVVMAWLVRTPVKPPVRRQPVSLDRFFLLKGIPAGVDLLLLSIPYGMTSNYVAMYAKQIGIQAETGFFFTCMAAGMAVSRLFSGRQVDKGRTTQVIAFGIALVSVCFFLLAACGPLMSHDSRTATLLFFGVAAGLGIGFGTMFPAFNSLFVNLAPNNQRGTATSTYLTSWDIGIGLGMMAGGYIAQVSTFDKAYFFGACLTVVSALYFNLKVSPHYHQNKLR
ncbi:MAG: MFS transporter [Bacteroidales bacterium]|nr:MFS transporter [Bacteroidales bacterium]